MNPRVLIPILIILLLLLSLWSINLDGDGGILPGAPDTGAAPVGERLVQSPELQIQAGLEAGERVVTRPGDRLQAGTRATDN